MTPPITSSGLNTQVGSATTLPNGRINYDITGGTRPGNGINLFHSFGEFSVPVNNIANFLNETMVPTANILSRVTGEQPSNIFGTLQTTGFGTANLYLMNPRGIVFGPTAELNVGGSVAFTTANYLRLADEARFYADLGQQSTLTSAQVAAFGFLGPTSGKITVNQSTLKVPDGKTLALVGGDISIVGGALTASGAPIEITAQDSIVISGVGPDDPTGIVNSTDSAGNRGDVTLSAATVRLENGATIQSTAANVGSAGTITIQGFEGRGSAATSVALDNATISTTISGGSAASSPATITFTADTVTLSNGARVTANTQGAAPAGDITFNVGTLTTRPGLKLLEPNPGNHTGVLIASDSNGLDTKAGPAGKITIQGVEGPGSAATSVSLQDSSISTKVFGGTADTPPATIIVTAGSVDISNKVVPDAAATFVATSLGSAPAGDIALNVNTLRVNVNPDGTPIEGAHFAFINSPSVLEDSTGGRAGTLTISGLAKESTDAASLIALNHIFITTTVLGGTAATLPATITMTADTISLTGETGIFSSTARAAPAGNIAFNVNTLRANVNPDGTLVNGQPQSFIASLSGRADSTAGRSGNLTVSGLGQESTDAAKLVALNNTEFNTNVAGGTAATLPATITMTADTLSLTNSRNIKANTSGAAPAGNITFNVNKLIADQATISSSSTGTATGNAGSVTIQGLTSPANSVLIEGAGSGIFTNTEGTGAGGNINLFAQSVTMQDGGTLSAATSGTAPTATGGTITVNANQVQINTGARVEASTTGAGNAGDITLTAVGDVTVTGLASDGLTRSGIFAKTQTSGGTAGGGGGGGSGGGSGGGAGGGGGQASTAGNAGDIEITTANLLLSAGAQIDSSTTTSGAGGSVAVTADSITITGRSTRLTSDASRGNGQGGSIALQANAIGIHDNASVTAATSGSGDAGNITMSAQQTFTLTTGATVTTSTRGSGEGGTIQIQAPQVLLDGPGTSITADTLRPFADLAVTLNILHPNDGDLTVRLDSPDGTRVALLSRVGDSGDNFTGTILDDQAAQPITSGMAPFTGMFRPREPLAQLIDEVVAGTWGVNVSDQAAGNTGSLESWSLRVGDQVFQSGNVPRNIPDNGSVSSNLLVTAPAGTVIQGVGEAPGIGGDVTVNAGTVTIQNGASLSATSRGSGRGGTLRVNASGPVALTGANSGLFTNAEGSGSGGNVNMQAARVDMTSGATISAASSGSGDAGNITINAGTTLLMENSSITTQATQASGGNIAITASDMVGLINSQINTSVAGGTGGGGNITIDPNFVILQSSQILAQAFAGQGGNINIRAGVFLADTNSLVSASSQFGLSGTVTIQSPTSNLSAVWARLQQNYADVAALVRARCAAQVSGGQSSFVLAGRDALPLEPGGWLLSPLALEGTAGAPPVAQDLSGPELTLAGVGLRGFDHDFSWPGVEKMPRRFASVLDIGCGS